MIYTRAMAARKTCPPSSSPEKLASGSPPPVGRGCRAATTVMSDVAVEQSFLSSLASKGLFLLFLLLYVAALLFRLQQMY